MLMVIALHILYMATSSCSSTKMNNYKQEQRPKSIALGNGGPINDGIPFDGWPLWRRSNELRILALMGNWHTARPILDTLAALSGNPETDQQILRLHYDILVFSIGAGKRALKFVENLIDHLPETSIRKTNEYGTTVLHAAAALGNKAAATLLVSKMPDLVYAIDNNGNYPIHRSAKFGHREALQYLMIVTHWNRNGNLNEDAEERQKLSLLLICVIEAKFFDIALRLVCNYPFVAVTKVAEQNKTALGVLAGMVDVVDPSFGFYRILWDSFLDTLHPVSKIFCGEDILKPHQLAWELTERICNEIKSLSPEEPQDIYKDAILKAATNGNFTVLYLILVAFPEAICMESDSGQSILHLAIKNRNESVVQFIYQSESYKHIDLEMRDSKGNNILHLAAKLPPRHILDRSSGPAIQIQREVQWYEAVKAISLPYCIHEENNDHKTPPMIFRDKHSKMRNEAEKWMKDTANSCCIVAVLIITIMFAATITVPGGNNNSTGLPLFKSNAAFIVFVVGDTVSLLTSTFSLMIFLSTNTTGHLLESFLFQQPKALISGLLTLFISITSMMVALTAAIYLVLGRKTVGVLIPTTIITGLAVIIFWVKHFASLYELIEITYSRGGMLGRKDKHPLF